MPLTNFPNGLTSFGFPLFGSGSFMTVEAVRSLDPTQQQIYFVSVNGSDGNSGQSPQDPFLTIMKAVNSCTSSKGSYVFLGEGRWQEQVTITQRGLHLIGMGAYRTQIQPASVMVAGDLVTPVVAVTPITGNALGVEIAGMRIGGNGGYTSLYLGDGAISGNASSSYVHDCLIDGSNYEGPYGLVIRGGSFILVEHNIFASILTASAVISSGAIRTAYGNVIRGNAFVNCKGVGVAIQDTSNSNQVIGNTFGDSSAAAMTTGIMTGATGVFGACTGTDNLAAGNYFGTTGTKITMGADDHASGNHLRSAGNAATFVTES